MSVTTYDGHENSVPLPPIPVGLPSSDVLYVLPANAQANWKPIYDDPSKQVIGFYTISSNIKHIYDIEGKFVTISEPGLESSYIIDDIIFLLVGIGEIRYILRGGRELIAVAGRRAGRAAVYGITAGIISESVITGLRVAFRQLATRQVFRFYDDDSRPHGGTRSLCTDPHFIHGDQIWYESAGPARRRRRGDVRFQGLQALQNRSGQRVHAKRRRPPAGLDHPSFSHGMTT